MELGTRQILPKVVLATAILASAAGCGSSQKNSAGLKQSPLSPPATPICHPVLVDEKLIITYKNEDFFPPDNGSEQMERIIKYGKNDKCINPGGSEYPNRAQGKLVGKVKDGDCTKGIFVYETGAGSYNPDQECQMAVLQAQLDAYAKEWEDGVTSIGIYEP